MRDAKKRGDENKMRAAKVRQKRLDERMGLQVNEKTGGRFKLSRDRAGFQSSLRAEIEVPTDGRDGGPRGDGVELPGTFGEFGEGMV